ncbi:MAG TPA: leucyl/phenylalanyl-tRNA--protein transferase [Novosphingobium sp.]|nr:leucyl/phenylalanyl-tRNA--protein transferase [Novosphingobium sp.]
MHAPTSSRIIEPDVLLLAYRGGIFPMADARDDPDVFWIEPRIRAILPIEHFDPSRSLARTLRRGRFTVTCDAAFAQVMEECAAPRPARLCEDGSEGEGGTWISHCIQASYQNLHRLGWAHSIECWQREESGRLLLVGGLYGVGFDRVFCGESMFSRVPDASKVALAWLVAALRRAGAELLDCQFMTPHLASLGAIEIDQEHYVERLLAAQRRYSASGAGAAGGAGGATTGVGAGVGAGESPPLSLPDAFGALLSDAAAAGFSSSPGNFIAQSLTHTS